MNIKGAANHSRQSAVLATVLALGACAGFHKADKVSPNDANLNSTWHATIASPTQLAGAVQMSGSASMAPGAKRGTTNVMIKLGNTSPGGMHPWSLHRGRCGADEGILGTFDDYSPLKVRSNGTADSHAVVKLDTPTMGEFFVSVQASPTNRELIVGCGNFAPPTT